MTHTELKERINHMSTSQLKWMSTNAFAILTDKFSEDLVRYMLTVFPDNSAQRERIKFIKEKYKQWEKDTSSPWEFTMPGDENKYPSYMEELEFDIECGLLVTDEESSTKSGKKTKKGAKTEATPAATDTSGLETRIHELEAENQQLKEEIKKYQEEDEEEEKCDDKVLYNKVSFELFLRLLEEAGFDQNNTGNKTRAGALWHMMTGKSADELRRFCSTRAYSNNHTKADIKRLNELLSEMGFTNIKL